MKFKEMGLYVIVDFIFPDNKRFSDNELSEIVQLVGSQYGKNSYEGHVNIRRLPVTDGAGMFATFTHINKPDYKHTTKGVIFKNNWLVQFTLKSDNMDSFGYKFAIQTLAQSILIKKN